MTNLEKLREAIVKAVPEIAGIGSKRDGHRIVATEVFRPITLADVLRAIGDRSGMFRVDSSGWFEVLNQVTGSFVRVAQWNLFKDNLDDQSPETLSFLSEVLL